MIYIQQKFKYTLSVIENIPIRYSRRALDNIKSKTMDVFSFRELIRIVYEVILENKLHVLSGDWYLNTARNQLYGSINITHPNHMPSDWTVSLGLRYPVDPGV